MPSNQLYSLAYVLLDGRLLTEHADMTLSRNSNANPVRTVAKGFAGMSPGAADCEIDVTNAVPAADFEFDPGTTILELVDVEIGVIGPGGRTATSRGYIISDSFSHGVGKESSMSFKFHGTFPKFEK